MTAGDIVIPVGATQRLDPPYHGVGEREMLDAWLEYHRQTLLQKCEGLTGEQLVLRTCEPSTITLLGLVRHMAEVERSWFRRGVDGQDVDYVFDYDDDHRDTDFDDLDAERAGDDVETLRTEISEARQVQSRHLSLDQTFTSRRGHEISLRWVLVHMIEEYARHNGHADFLRERIDGAVGD